MPRLLARLVLAVAGLALALLVAGQAGLLQGRPPADLGVRDGRLKPPSDTPNSVHSQAALWPAHPQLAYARIEPLPLIVDGPTTIARVKAAVETLPGAKVVAARPDYLYVSFETRWLRFVDDAEFWLEPSGAAIQVRSASRLGRKDFGVNRARIEAIRERHTAGT